MTAAAKHIKGQFILVTKVLQVVFIILFWASVECAHCAHVNVNIIENVLIFEYIPIYVHVPGAARINWKAPNTKYMKTMTSGGFVLSYIMPYWSLSPFAWQVNEIGLNFNWLWQFNAFTMLLLTHVHAIDHSHRTSSENTTFRTHNSNHSYMIMSINRKTISQQISSCLR